MSEQAWARGDGYKIQAFYPDSRLSPEVSYAARWADALNDAVAIAKTGKHTTIRVLTPDIMEVIKLWGQLDGMP